VGPVVAVMVVILVAPQLLEVLIQAVAAVVQVVQLLVAVDLVLSSYAIQTLILLI
jgi:hypothetical protein